MSSVQLNMFDGKVCTKCKEWKLVRCFSKSSRYPDGLRTWCKDCETEASLRYYHEKHQQNPEVYRKRDRDRYARNSEQRKEWQREYRANNPSVIRGQRRKYRANHPDEIRDKIQRYFASEQGKAVRKAAHQRRRSRLYGNGGSYTAHEWASLCSWFGNICLLCGATDITVDHVLPLSKGGTNTIGNLQPLCGRCNMSKHNHYVDYRDPDRLAVFMEHLYATSERSTDS